MNRFIEVTDTQGVKHVINTKWIEEIVSNGSGCVIYFAFNCVGAFEQDYLNVVNSYENLKEMLIRG